MPRLVRTRRLGFNVSDGSKQYVKARGAGPRELGGFISLGLANLLATVMICGFSAWEFAGD